MNSKIVVVFLIACLAQGLVNGNLRKKRDSPNGKAFSKNVVTHTASKNVVTHTASKNDSQINFIWHLYAATNAWFKAEWIHVKECQRAQNEIPNLVKAYEVCQESFHNIAKGENHTCQDPIRNLEHIVRDAGKHIQKFSENINALASFDLEEWHSETLPIAEALKTSVETVNSSTCPIELKEEVSTKIEQCEKNIQAFVELIYTEVKLCMLAEKISEIQKQFHPIKKRDIAGCIDRMRAEIGQFAQENRCERCAACMRDTIISTIPEQGSPGISRNSVDMTKIIAGIRLCFQGSEYEAKFPEFFRNMRVILSTCL